MTEEQIEILAKEMFDLFVGISTPHGSINAEILFSCENWHLFPKMYSWNFFFYYEHVLLVYFSNVSLYFHVLNRVRGVHSLNPKENNN